MLLWSVFTFPHFIMMFSILNQFLLLMFRKFVILFKTKLSLFFFFFFRKILISFRNPFFWPFFVLLIMSSWRDFQFFYTYKRKLNNFSKHKLWKNLIISIQLKIFIHHSILYQIFLHQIHQKKFISHQWYYYLSFYLCWCIYIVIKAIGDKSFYLFYKLNQSLSLKTNIMRNFFWHLIIIKFFLFYLQKNLF